MFRLKPVTEVSKDTKIQFLAASWTKISWKEKKAFYCRYALENTALHEAVLKNDCEEVKKLLMEEKESTNINAVSLMNTPLLLALKQGNTHIAKCILTIAKESKLKLDINHADARDLTALDWACMLRDDEVIRMILSWPGLILTKMSYAKALYNQPIVEKFFADFITRTHATEFAENGGFPHLCIFFQEPYSDMAYFMRDICINRGIMQTKEFSTIQEISHASHLLFYRCFQKGYQAFCNHRNQIPVNPELLTAMLSQESLVEWQKQTAALLDDTDTLLSKDTTLSVGDNPTKTEQPGF